MSSRWRKTSPQELAGWLSDVTVPWGFAGGWALDLWLGETTREHSDIEIACFHGDLARLLPSLQGFEIAVARNKRLTPYRASEPLPSPPFSLWLRRAGERLWDFEIVAESQQNGAWAYRRASTIQRPIHSTFATSTAGLPIVAPEIQLLYKCKEPRPKDIEDLRRCLPHLEAEAIGWLRSVVAVAHPEFLATLDDIVAARCRQHT